MVRLEPRVLEWESQPGDPQTTDPWTYVSLGL